MSRTSFRTLIPRLLVGLAPVTLATVPSFAQQPAVIDKDSYALPPKAILDAVTAIATPGVSLTNLSPNGKTFLLPKSEGMPSVDRVAKPHIHLAGIALDPGAKRAHDLYVRSVSGFDLFDHATKTTRTINAPAGARFSTPTWSADGNQIAFFVLTDDATHVAVADVATGTYRTVTKTPVLATLNTTLQWSKDGKRILTVLVPDEAKVAAAVAAAPKVRVARPGPNPTRTIRFLLESPTDAALLETLATGQLALVDVADGKVTKVGTPAMIRTASAAPGEEQFRVTEMKKPFSYYVLASSFGSLESVWDNGGKSLFTIQDRKLRETEPTPPPTTVATAPGGTPPAPGGGGGRGAATPGAGGRGNRGGRGGPAGGANPAVAGAQPPTDPMTPPTDPMNPTVPTGPVDPTDPDAAPRPFPTTPVDPDGKRDLAWRNDGLGLSYLQLEPIKDEKKEPKSEPKSASEQDPAKGPAQPAKDTKDAKAAPAPPRKDRVMLWRPPFGKDDTTVVYETPDRILNAAYSEDGSFLFLTQVVNSQRQITAVDLKDTKTTYVVHRSGTPRTPPEPKKETAPMPKAADTKKPEQQPPGGRGGRGGAGGGGAIGGVTLMTKPGRGGVSVARISSAGDVYVTGSDRVPGGGGSKPYLEKISIKTGTKKRIFEAKGDMTETIDAVDGDDVSLVFTTKQKSDVVPDSYVTDVKSGTTTKLTNNVDRAPWQKDLKTERFRVTRIDGFKFWVKVTTPKNASGKLPALFWIYPREFTDQAQYDQRAGQGGAAGTGGPGGVGAGRFVTPGVRSMNLLCLLGYAVVEPDVPIVGPAGRMNDNYIPDLRNGLWAAIDELDKRGIIDRDRLACGGHSYGAFSTANAMAHTPFFKAGIAGDGNFNRTLTPMSFQTERRNLWDARETYLEMSPFLWANRINGALLMYHGLDDANVGTNPVNSEFLYMALDGLGKPCALYMYPGEGHGPIAKETTLDLWARWSAWLDTYVKNPTPTKDEKKEEKKVEKK
jgi:dipeptidyl aminopeptidase/acylaminoacyl peptidase